MAKGFWLLLVLSVVSLIGAFLLEKSLTQHYILVLVLLIAGVIVLTLSTIAVGVDSPWGWPIATICFAGITVLSLVMYLATRAQALTFLSTLVVSLAGVIAGVVYVGSDELDALDDLPKVHFEKPKAKKAKTAAAGVRPVAAKRKTVRLTKEERLRRQRLRNLKKARIAKAKNDRLRKQRRF